MKVGRNDVGLLLDSQMRYHLLFDFPNLEILSNYIVIIYMIGNNIDTHFNNGYSSFASRKHLHVFKGNNQKF